MSVIEHWMIRVCPQCRALLDWGEGWACKHRVTPDEGVSVEVRPSTTRGPVPLDDPELIGTLARALENRHGTLHGIGDTLREALAELKRSRGTTR